VLVSTVDLAWRARRAAPLGLTGTAGSFAARRGVAL